MSRPARPLGRRLPALAVAAALAACSWGGLRPGYKEDGEVVDAEGWAPLVAGDILAAKRSSLADAQRKAVERVLGVFISAKTRVSQAAQVDENILAKLDGYVRRYEVLSEKEDGGFYKTRIRALVLYKKVGEDLKRMGMVLDEAPPGNPQVSVRISSKRGGSADGARASAAVRRGLLERGFQVADKGESGAGGDILVRGDAEAYPIEGLGLAGFISYRARVSLEAVKTATGDIVGRQSQEASALDPAADIAAGKALENAGLLAGQELAREMSQGLRSRVSVALVVSGVGDLASAQGLAEDLRLQPEIAGVSLAEYRRDSVRFSVVTDNLPGEELAALLSKLRRRPLSIGSVTPYLIEASLKR